MLTYTMKRTTVKIPEELDTRIRREAERRGVTFSQITREALEHYLGPPTTPDGRRVFLSAGAGSSGRSDISEHIEEILAGEYPL